VIPLIFAFWVLLGAWLRCKLWQRKQEVVYVPFKATGAVLTDATEGHWGLRLALTFGLCEFHPDSLAQSVWAAPRADSTDR